jgi:hypothetical protein
MSLHRKILGLIGFNDRSNLYRILCRAGMHVRSRKNAKRTETGWKSVCRGCGLPMFRLKGADWRVMSQPEPPTREERIRQRDEDARKRRTPPPRRKRSSDR